MQANANEVTIIACGGAGINIVSAMRSMVSAGTEAGFAKFRPFYIDTSDSNLKGMDIDASNVYRFDGVDGSGKRRITNYEHISERAREIILQSRPTDVTIIVHSASGGSGSVIGPVLASELMTDGKQVIVVLVGSTDSRIETDNNVKTLKSYENIAITKQKPVACVYYEITNEVTRMDVDQHARGTIALLGVVLSGQNRELDSKDISNFLNYTTTTGYEPCLAQLEVFDQTISPLRGTTVMTLLSLTEEAVSAKPNVLVEYQATGFIPDTAKSKLSMKCPIHFALVEGYFHEVIKRQEALVHEFDDLRRSGVRKSILDSESASKAKPNGPVF